MKWTSLPSLLRITVPISKSFRVYKHSLVAFCSIINNLQMLNRVICNKCCAWWISTLLVTLSFWGILKFYTSLLVYHSLNADKWEKQRLQNILLNLPSLVQVKQKAHYFSQSINKIVLMYACICVTKHFISTLSKIIDATLQIKIIVNELT